MVLSFAITSSIMKMASEERAVAAVIGAAVADAACQPVHWNYDRGKLDMILKEHEHPEFLRPSQNPFYCIETGKQSCYGDQAYVVLKSLTACKGLDANHLKKSMYEKFGPGSEYDLTHVNSYVSKTDVRDQKKYPVKGPWKHSSIKDFIKKYETGREETGSDTDSQIDSVTKIAPIVAFYAGQPEMLTKVEEMVSVTQLDDMPIVCALFAARILERIILYGDEEDLIDKVLADVRSTKRSNPHSLDKSMASLVNRVMELQDMDPIHAVKALGIS